MRTTLAQILCGFPLISFLIISVRFLRNSTSFFFHLIFERGRRIRFRYHSATVHSYI